MKILLSQLILSFLFVAAFSADIVKDQTWLKNYFLDLKKTYDKRVAPTDERNPDSPVKVAVSMFILDISHINDNSMDYSAIFYFRQSWNDSRLRYTDRSENLVLRSAEDVWTPDLFFTTGREGSLHTVVHPNVFLRIKPSGEVLYSIRVTVKFSCPMDLQYFPHDIQKCEMRIESYGHVKKDIEVEWFDGRKSFDFGKNIKLHNFDLIDFKEGELSETVTTGEYKVLSLTLTFQRKFGYYAIKLYIPFIILVSLSFVSLWIKAEERSIRMAFLLIVLYFMINVAWEVTCTIPPAPYTKGSDVWIGFCKSLVFAVFLEFVAVALISRRHEGEISENKGEILLNMEADSKEQSMKSDTLKSHLCKFVNMFDARSGGKGKRDASAYRIDRVSRIVFPLIFILFNIIYWSVYCCKPTE